MQSKTKFKQLLLLLLIFTFSDAIAFGQTCGDINADGSTDIIDALLVAQCYVGLTSCPSADIGDVNCDGSIDIIDGLLIAQLYVGLITSLHCCDTPTDPPDPTPEITPGEDVTLEMQAEDATWDDAAVESEHSGYTGSGYVNTANSAGRWIEWTVDVSNACNAVCVFTYAVSGSGRPVDLSVNGNGSGSLSFPDTGAWTTWSTQTADIILSAGSNAIRLTATGSGGAANIDKMDITISGGEVVTPTPTPDPTPTLTPRPTRDPNETPGPGDILPQDGNPVHARFDLYKDYMSKADNILSFQLNCGGWEKNDDYDSPGSGGSANGTFDNGATTMEMTVMAAAYKNTGESKYLNAARKAMDYVLEAQYPEGGWPQYYPLRGGYSDHVTFNDDGMSRVLTLLHHAVDKSVPLDSDVYTNDQLSRARNAIDKGVDYILKAQIMQNGKKTAWCAQHGKSDYQPKQGRAYEHPSISGCESIEIIGFLMTQPQVPEIQDAVIAALDWFRSPNTYLADYFYDKTKEGSNPFVPQVGSKVWYRFYDIPTNLPIFSNYDGVIYLGLENQDKKKSGYRWGGDYGDRIIPYADSVGY